MYGGSHKQHNATQRDQRARHATASNHPIRYFLLRKNAVVLAERARGCRKRATESMVMTCADLVAWSEGWRAQGDDFRTFLSGFVSCLPQVETQTGYEALFLFLWCSG